MITETDDDAPPSGFEPLRDRPDAELFAGPFYERELPDGTRQLGFRVTERKLNNMGMCHGGVLALFADIQAGVIKRAMKISADAPTINLSIDFVAPARLGAWVWSRPEVVRQTGGLLFLQSMVHADDQICLRLSGIYRLRPRGDGND